MLLNIPIADILSDIASDDLRMELVRRGVPFDVDAAVDVLILAGLPGDIVTAVRQYFAQPVADQAKLEQWKRLQ